MNTLKIINIFRSIDGEAYHAGRPTVFVRTFGCNLRCAYPCDTPESWDMGVFNKLYNRPLFEMTPEAAVEMVRRLGPDIYHVTVTGGEPLLPENVPWMEKFTYDLVTSGYTVDFETNGAVPLTDIAKWRDDWALGNRVHFIMDWKCPSSKMTARMIPENLDVMKSWDVVKCVVADDDFDEVEKVRARLNSETPIYISPSFGKVTMCKIPEFVMERPKQNYCCQLQQHKYFWDPTTKDV